MPRERITLKLLRALIDAGVAIDAGTMSECYWLDLLAQPRTVLAVSAGANGALFVVFGRLYAVVGLGRTARLQQLI